MMLPVANVLAASTALNSAQIVARAVQLVRQLHLQLATGGGELGKDHLLFPRNSSVSVQHPGQCKTNLYFKYIDAIGHVSTP